jgi:hypothetical protein
MVLLELECGDVDWIGLPLDKDKWIHLVNAVINLLVPQHAVSSGYTIVGLSSSVQINRVSKIVKFSYKILVTLYKTTRHHVVNDGDLPKLRSLQESYPINSFG